jgi:hypothetical protein
LKLSTQARRKSKFDKSINQNSPTRKNSSLSFTSSTAKSNNYYFNNLNLPSAAGQPDDFDNQQLNDYYSVVNNEELNEDLDDDEIDLLELLENEDEQTSADINALEDLLDDSEEKYLYYPPKVIIIIIIKGC